MSETDVFCPTHRYSNSQLNPKSVIEKLVPDPVLATKIANLPPGRARCIILRVTPETRKFFKLVEEHVRDESLLLSRDLETYPGARGFICYCVEQSIFNILAYREGIFPLDIRGTWIERWPDIGHEPGIGVDKVVFNR